MYPVCIVAGQGRPQGVSATGAVPLGRPLPHPPPVPHPPPPPRPPQRPLPARGPSPRPPDWAATEISPAATRAAYPASTSACPPLPPFPPRPVLLTLHIHSVAHRITSYMFAALSPTGCSGARFNLLPGSSINCAKSEPVPPCLACPRHRSIILPTTPYLDVDILWPTDSS